MPFSAKLGWASGLLLPLLLTAGNVTFADPPHHDNDGYLNNYTYQANGHHSRNLAYNVQNYGWGNQDAFMHNR